MNDWKTALAHLQSRIAEQNETLGNVLSTLERGRHLQLELPTHLVQSLEEAASRVPPRETSSIPLWAQRA